VKIVVWDNIGNTLLGMRPWDAWPTETQQRLEREHPDARSRIVTLPEALTGHNLELVWLHDPHKAQRGFRSLFDEFGARLVETTDPQAIDHEIADADFLITHKEMLPSSAIEHAGQLRLIQHLGRDYRGIPLAVARARSIPVAATPLVNYSAVAEHVWAMILTDLKRMVDQREYMQTRSYLNEWGSWHPGVQIVSDLTLGLLGLGEIARHIARIAQGFEMRAVYWDIERFPELEAGLGVEYLEWDEIFRQSDVLSLQLALNEHTEGIVGAREFSLMKSSAMFINTARGKLVDENALIAALEAETIRAAALDVYATEPLPAASPLHDLHEDVAHRVILTPHSASHAPWTWVRDSQELWFNVRRVLDGETPKYLV
jgi:phosphoglycerate dehydrogenase-like enzyme